MLGEETDVDMDDKPIIGSECDSAVKSFNRDKAVEIHEVPSKILLPIGEVGGIGYFS